MAAKLPVTSSNLPDSPSIYFAGDTAVFSDMQLIAQLYRPDLAFPNDRRFLRERPTLGGRLLGTKQVVPMHFGTFPALTGTPDALKRELTAASISTQVWPLEIGKPVKW